jgi:hypothetical protein
MTSFASLILDLFHPQLSTAEDIPRATHSPKGDGAHLRHNVAGESSLDTSIVVKLW